MGGQANTITPAYSARFSAAFDKLLQTEGGFVNDATDAGGATNYGVSLRFLVANQKLVPDILFDLDMDGDIDADDVRRMTPAQAKAIYWRCFWTPMGCETWPAPIGEAMFDEGVNGGALAAKRLLQDAINRCTSTRHAASGCPAPLKLDGQLGAVTQAAFAWALPRAAMPALIGAYRAAAADRYRAIVAAHPDQKKFLNGWLARAAKLGAAS